MVDNWTGGEILALAVSGVIAVGSWGLQVSGYINRRLGIVLISVSGLGFVGILAWVLWPWLTAHIFEVVTVLLLVFLVAVTLYQRRHYRRLLERVPSAEQRGVPATELPALTEPRANQESIKAIRVLYSACRDAMNRAVDYMSLDILNALNKQGAPQIHWWFAQLLEAHTITHLRQARDSFRERLARPGSETSESAFLSLCRGFSELGEIYSETLRWALKCEPEIHPTAHYDSPLYKSMYESHAKLMDKVNDAMARGDLDGGLAAWISVNPPDPRADQPSPAEAGR